MARAFQGLFETVTASVIGVLALLFLVIRRDGVRVALLVLLVVIGLLTPLLL